jgi:hypothetical protein
MGDGNISINLLKAQDIPLIMGVKSFLSFNTDNSRFQARLGA